MFEYKILKQLSIHSLYNYQISVITMSDKQGIVYKGIAVLPPPDAMFFEESTVTGNCDQPLIVDHRQALLLCRFIGAVLSGSLPKKIEVKTNGPTLKIHLKKFEKKWYGDGGYRGKVYFKSIFSFLPFTSNATVARNSLSSLRYSLIRLYELEKMEGMDA
jgi:hypothetical protein